MNFEKSSDFDIMTKEVLFLQFIREILLERVFFGCASTF